MNSSASTNVGDREVVVAIGIVIAGDALLICQRKPDAVLAGLWEFPGGKIEPGETPAQAVVRELIEELAIRVTPTETLESIVFEYEHATVRLIPILCTIDTGKPIAIGCQTFNWVNVKDLKSYDFPQANAPLLRALEARFGTLKRGT